MNEVGKKAGPPRDFRNNYAQKLASKMATSGSSTAVPTPRNKQSRDGSKKHQGTRPTPRNEESRDGSRNTKGRDQHQGTSKAGTEARKKH